jgi:hypothetical protein
MIRTYPGQKIVQFALPTVAAACISSTEDNDTAKTLRIVKAEGHAASACVCFFFHDTGVCFVFFLCVRIGKKIRFTGSRSRLFKIIVCDMRSNEDSSSVPAPSSTVAARTEALIMSWGASFCFSERRCARPFEAAHFLSGGHVLPHNTRQMVAESTCIAHRGDNSNQFYTQMWVLPLLALYNCCGRLCRIVVRVPGYSSRGSGSIPGSRTGSSQPR